MDNLGVIYENNEEDEDEDKIYNWDKMIYIWKRIYDLFLINNLLSFIEIL